MPYQPSQRPKQPMIWISPIKLKNELLLLMLKRVSRFIFCSQLDISKLTLPQRKNLIHIPQEIYQNPLISQKQSLIIYLLQRCSPSTETFLNRLCRYIIDSKINSNSDIERILRYSRQKAMEGYDYQSLDWNAFELEFFSKSTNDQLIDEIRMMISNKESNNCKLALRRLQTRFPNLSSQVIYYNFQEQLRSNQILVETDTTPVTIYERIQSFNPRDLKSAINTQERIQEHLRITGGKIQLRFPPEPNGYLHLGHVRSIWLNFYSALKLEGVCYLRYDDTNPSTEKIDYINSIAQDIEWFGYTPSKVTYASDYFPQLFGYALQLIRGGKAYVCEQSRDQMHEARRNKEPSPFRERNPIESEQIFHEMREGQHPESKYSLRLKIDYQNPNSTLRDPVIYRVKFHRHPRTNNQWSIYPIYDFAHCICDSIENITHSLCTLEFEIRRFINILYIYIFINSELYYWILDELQLYKPLVYEFSRLNISNNLLSKRKIQKLIESARIPNWDDPRLLTLCGLRRRGYTPTSLLRFIESINVSRNGNENIIQQNALESFIRKELDETAPRIMAILEPLEITVQDDFSDVNILVPLFYKSVEDGVRTITVTKNMFIERKDFRLEANEQFYGLCPGKEVALRHFAVVKCVGYETNLDGNISRVIVKVTSRDLSERKKCKGQLNWISEADYMETEVREYGRIFDAQNPNEVEDFLQEFIEDSIRITKAFIPRWELVAYGQHQRWQFERLGYYILDKNSKYEGDDRKLVFNRIVSLREQKKIY